MAAQSDRLGAVSDNIANVSTHGYKKSSTEFSTFVLDAGISEYQSGSVQSNIRHAVSQQAGFDYTSSSTDLAIAGAGFFVVAGQNGQPVLTRAGSFVKDGNGNLVNGAGFKLLGYPSDGGSTGVANGFTGLVPVNLTSLALQANPSTEGTLSLNLPAAATAVTVPAPPALSPLPSANTAGATPTAKTSLVVYDSLGKEVTLDLYTTKTGTNTWEIAAYDRSTASSATAPFPYSSAALATANLTFNPATGALAAASPNSLSLTVPSGAALKIDLSQTSQLAADYTVLAAQANGNAPSEVDRVDISSAGVLSAVYKNGSRIAAYQVPIADVVSPDNLETLAGNVYSATSTSGVVQLGAASSGGKGSILSSALEKSTVDLASELTTMIEAQKNYTANSKVFQTGTELLDVLVGLAR